MNFFKRKNKVEEPVQNTQKNVIIPNSDDFIDGLQDLTQDPSQIEEQQTYSERDYSIMYFWKNCQNFNYTPEQIKATIERQYPNSNLSDLDIGILHDLQRYKFSPEGLQELAQGSEKAEYMSNIDNVLGVVENIISTSIEEAEKQGYNVNYKSPRAQKIISNYAFGKSGKCIDTKYKESLEINQDDISL